MANRAEQISSQIVAPPSDGLQFMCRICSNYEVSINIFSELGIILHLEEKIRKCLRLDVIQDGLYPNNVCMGCLGKLNISYELHQMAESTQEKIKEELTRVGRLPVAMNPVIPNGKFSDPVIVPESVQSLSGPPPVVVKSEGGPKVLAAAPHLVPSPIKRPASPESTTFSDSPSKKERKTVCSTCGEWFFKSELAAHTKRVHQTVTLVFGCVNCSANFSSQDELTRHSESCL